MTLLMTKRIQMRLPKMSQKTLTIIQKNKHLQKKEKNIKPITTHSKESMKKI